MALRMGRLLGAALTLILMAGCASVQPKPTPDPHDPFGSIEARPLEGPLSPSQWLKVPLNTGSWFAQPVALSADAIQSTAGGAAQVTLEVAPWAREEDRSFVGAWGITVLSRHEDEPWRYGGVLLAPEFNCSTDGGAAEAGALDLAPRVITVPLRGTGPSDVALAFFSDPRHRQGPGPFVERASPVPFGFALAILPASANPEDAKPAADMAAFLASRAPGSAVGIKATRSSVGMFADAALRLDARGAFTASLLCLAGTGDGSSPGLVGATGLPGSTGALTLSDAMPSGSTFLEAFLAGSGSSVNWSAQASGDGFPTLQGGGLWPGQNSGNGAAMPGRSVLLLESPTGHRLDARLDLRELAATSGRTASGLVAIGLATDLASYLGTVEKVGVVDAGDRPGELLGAPGSLVWRVPGEHTLEIVIPR